MTAKIIAVVNQKGGAGKTTLSMQLAGTLGSGEASKKPYKVLVVDADMQGTATRWAAAAEDAQPFPATVAGLSAASSRVHREVKKFIEDYDFIIIDCPPAADSPVPQSALMISDLALVPIVPSPPDLWAAVGIKQVILNISDSNEDLQARLVLNQCQLDKNGQLRTALARDTQEVLSEFGIELTDTKLGQRQVYRLSAGYGQTVHSFGREGKKAISEINALTREVLALLDVKG